MLSDIEEIKESLNFLNDIDLEQRLYKYFIDNKIDRDILKTLLDDYKCEYPVDLFEYPDWYIKSYKVHTKTIVKFDNDSYYFTKHEIFNINYFKMLCNKSKKNKEITNTLIDYSNHLKDIVIHIMTMKNVRLNNLNYYLMNDKWKAVGTKYNCKTLFDLYSVITDSKINIDKTIDKNKLLEEYINFLADSKILNFDINILSNRFCLDMEVLLLSLSSKVANTFRIKFLIYKEDYLEPNEYNSTITNCRMLISKNKGSLSSSKLMDIKKRYAIYVDSFPLNGYKALYYSLFEE